MHRDHCLFAKFGWEDFASVAEHTGGRPEHTLGGRSPEADQHPRLNAREFSLELRAARCHVPRTWLLMQTALPGRLPLECFTALVT
jgi:hypothetical protein